MIVVTFYIKVGPYEGIEDMETKYIRIIPTPLTVQIRGGRFISASRQKSIEISAKDMTFDADAEDQSGLDYTWKYRVKGTTAWSVWDFNVNGRKKRALTNPVAILTIPPNFLPAGLYEIFMLVVTGVKSGTFTQVINVQDGLVPDLIIG